MNTLIKILNIVSMVGLILTIVGVALYYSIEFISSFFVKSIELGKIGGPFWNTIFVCGGITLVSFVLSHLLFKKY